MVAGYFDNGWVVANKPLQGGTNKSLALRVVVVECVSSVACVIQKILNDHIMPFPCINITDLSHSCSKLLTYCNNNYAAEVDWCNCFNNNYNDKCDSVALPLSAILIIAIL